MTKEYFHIERQHLPEGMEIFSFNIFIYNPVNKSYTLFLHANSPLDSEREEDLKVITSKGGELAIDRRQAKTFLITTNQKREDIPSLKKKEKHELELQREQNIEKFKNKVGEEDNFKLNETINKAILNDNFMPLIERMKDEVMCFDVKISETTSLAIDLSRKLLTEDTSINRIAALTYFLAKISKIEDEKSLGKLIVASFLHHIGFTQLECYYSYKPLNEMSDKQRKEYKKHPGLAQHLIRKCGLKVDPQVHTIILEHHERTDGTGFPQGKREAQINQLSQILGICSHVIEFCTGRMTGSKTNLNAVAKYLKNNSIVPGLELSFNDRIKDSLVSMIEKKDIKKAS